MSKIYLVQCETHNNESFVGGCASTKEKAEKILAALKEVFEDSVEYTIEVMAIDAVMVDDQLIKV